MLQLHTLKNWEYIHLNMIAWFIILVISGTKMSRHFFTILVGTETKQQGLCAAYAFHCSQMGFVVKIWWSQPVCYHHHQYVSETIG